MNLKVELKNKTAWLAQMAEVERKWRDKEIDTGDAIRNDHEHARQIQRVTALAEEVKTLETKVAALEPAKPVRYTGALIKSGTGTTHHVNGWGELYCGRYVEVEIDVPNGYATCLTCSKAMTAAHRDDTFGTGGSPARRD